MNIRDEYIFVMGLDEDKLHELLSILLDDYYTPTPMDREREIREFMSYHLDEMELRPFLSLGQFDQSDFDDLYDAIHSEINHRVNEASHNGSLYR